MMDKISGKILIIVWLAGSLILTSCDRNRKREDTAGSADQTAYDSTAIQKSKDIISHRTLGLAHLEENQLEEAESEFLQLIELAPDEALGYANLGIVYMRMGKYEMAESQLKKAVELNPDDPDIRLNLAKVYDLLDKEEASREELEKTVEIDPEHVQSLYSLAESYQNQQDEYSVNQWEKYLQKIVDASPANIVARVYLTEVQIKKRESDEAIMNLEEIERISPAFPGEANDYFRRTIDQLRSDSLVAALTSLRIFHNMIKLTNNYQTDIQKLKGTTASRVGVPVISFSEAVPGFLMEGESLLDVIRYTDATSSAGLDVMTGNGTPENVNGIPDPVITTGDMDRDGDQDVYFAGFDVQSGKFVRYLLMNEMGRFKDIAEDAGIDHNGPEQNAIFSDYNNDGFLDLYISRNGANALYENVSEGKFKDNARSAGVDVEEAGNQVLLFDMDQEGDLDLLLANPNSTRAFQNNGDGTFTDKTSGTAFGDLQKGCRDAEFGDFDDDGDVDLILIREDGTSFVYSNLRDGNFLDVTEKCGLRNTGPFNAITSGDYNNDGFEDLVFLTENQGMALYVNAQDGTFTSDKTPENIVSALSGTMGSDVLLFDFDNDGLLDIFYVGKPVNNEGRGVFLFHNTGNGEFQDASFILPEDLLEGQSATVMDYNEDGDMDILITGKDYGIRLLRNDGGNVNHHIKVQLVGIRTGSGKNNHFGIGAKIEVRAGELYQMKTIREPNVHFGLGTRDKVDVVRILWTNGVPQNIFSPGSDQDLIEEQELKGSCPFLYTWNGTKFDFLKDMMWRSALGMPLGIMGGNTSYAFADASREHVKIPGDQLKAKNGAYQVRITAELWETIYFDQLKLIAVDHPAEVEIYVDEKFTGPPFPELKIYQVKNKRYPVSVRDGNNHDLLTEIREKDHQYVTNFHKAGYQGLTEMHDLIIDLGKVDTGEDLMLFLNGWIFPTDASINVAIAQNPSLTVQPPRLEALNRLGNWETILENIGFPAGKDKTVVVDLSGKLPDPEKAVVRIRTNMEIYWDHIFYATDGELQNDRLISLEPEKADLHYRGFSATYRKGGRYGPFWFDYSRVTEQPKWRDLEGQYTKYGSVTDLVKQAESHYVVMNAGDEMSVGFDARELPDLTSGWKRDFILYSVGWVKDGDMNTAHGNSAGPYPFHGMTSYPYPSEERNQIPASYTRYFEKYNSREVSNKAFRNEIRKGEQR